LNQDKQIKDKTLKVIASCNSIKYFNILYTYFDLACKRIKNYNYIEEIEIALHNKTEGIIENRRIKEFENK